MTSRRAVLANLRRISTLKAFAVSFLTGLGVTAGLSGLASGLFPDFTKEHGWSILALATAVALAYAAYMAWPRLSHSRSFQLPSTRVSIVVGDLFDQDGHLVIGMTDTFDTSMPDVIVPGSIQGQFALRVYGNPALLDEELARALANVPIISTEARDDKPLGKLDRYPIGTVAVLGGERKYYGLAYGRLGNDNAVRSSVSDIWNSLAELWPVVRRTGGLGTVSIATLGLGLARLSGQISTSDIVRLIIISYMAASREAVVATHLRIVISPERAEHIDLRRLADYLAAQ